MGSTELRNAWDKARERYSKAKLEYDKATVEHDKAVISTNSALAAFKTSLNLNAANCDSTCKAAHKEYNVLKMEVASNVRARKEVYIATLVVMCYVDHLDNNAAAKACADKARGADRTRWNISPAALAPCESAKDLMRKWGPLDWQPTYAGCAEHRRIRDAEKNSKEKASKEVKAKEASTKEAAAKKVEKERTDKERAAKAKVERDNKAFKENKAKADERTAKERSSKEASAKESTNKANEKKSKAAAAAEAERVSTRNSFTCATRSTRSNNAGVIYIGPHSGYTTTGGGMNNHYRSWDAKSAFEEMMPEGDRFRCDTGFGPGQLTCYSQSCKVNGGLSCGIWSGRFTGSGSKTVNVPSGYTMTGGGLYNHYRSFNQKAGFEESYPHGNGWKGDMGFGWGDYTVYVLSCTNAVSGRGNSGTANCPGGYKLTGCGIVNHYRSWDAKAGFEQTHPHGNGCLCDSGFGHGDMQCYARCCKVN